MVEVKHSGKSTEQRARDRTKNSGDTAHADHILTGDKDMKLNIYNSRNQQYGEGECGVDIHGNKRGQV